MGRAPLAVWFIMSLVAEPTLGSEIHLHESEQQEATVVFHGKDGGTCSLKYDAGKLVSTCEIVSPSPPAPPVSPPVPPTHPPTPPALPPDYGFSDAEAGSLLAAIGVPDMQYFTATPGNDLLLNANNVGLLSDADAATLATIFTNVPGITITSLDLEHQKLGEARLSAIFQGLLAADTATGGLQLTILNVGHCALEDGSTTTLASFLKQASLPQLTTLTVMFNNIRETGALALVDALNHPGAMPSLTRFVGQSQAKDSNTPPAWIGWNHYDTCMGNVHYTNSFGLACTQCSTFCDGCGAGLPSGYPRGPARGQIYAACEARSLQQCSN